MFASHSGRLNYIDLGMGMRPLECSALGMAQPDMPALPRTLLLATCLRSALPSYTTFSMKRSYPKSGPSSNSLASKLRADNHWHVLPYTYMYFCFLDKALGMPLTSLKQLSNNNAPSAYLSAFHTVGPELFTEDAINGL